MKVSSDFSDDAILAEIGQRVARHRLDLQLTQATVAEQAGVSKRTLERIEAGASAQMSTLIRVFRVLGLVQNMDRLVPENDISPMDFLSLKGKRRQRASSVKHDRVEEKDWSWGNEE